MLLEGLLPKDLAIRSEKLDCKVSFVDRYVVLEVDDLSLFDAVF